MSPFMQAARSAGHGSHQQQHEQPSFSSGGSDEYEETLHADIKVVLHIPNHAKMSIQHSCGTLGLRLHGQPRIHSVDDMS